jgi:hypothetical protein
VRVAGVRIVDGVWNIPRAGQVCVTVEHCADAIGDITGVDLEHLPPMTTLLVSTRNSSYQIVVIEGANIYLHGGTPFPQPTPAYIDGARIGGGLLRVGWIVVGLRMEIRTGERRIVTSPVRAITAQPPGAQTVD